MPLDPAAPRRRNPNPDRKDAREATHALAATISRMEAWQNRARILQALVRSPAADRAMILSEAKSIRGQIMGARTEVIMILVDASAGVRGNSRVVDVEKALDGLDETLREIERVCRT